MKNVTFLFFLLFSVTVLPQNWQRIDSIFHPSGVVVQDFTAPVFGDLDADGDFDLILGHIGSKINYFENIGTQQEPNFLQDTSMFSSVYAAGTQFTNADYPAVVDLDNDNDLDLIISGYNGILFYENKGDSSTPVWGFEDYLFIDINTVIGSDAKPAFADLDGDGDLDLFVGIGESLLGGPVAGISMGFRNIGTPEEPFFERYDDFVLGIPDVGVNAYPTLCDIDGDEDFDLLMGRDGSQIFYYRNTGSKEIPVWTREYTVFQSVENVNYWKDPTFCDLDGDSDQDLIYGTDNGHLYFYENTGSVSSPAFIYNTNYFKLIKSDFSTPSSADFDGDGDFDVISGSNYSGFLYLKNIGTSTSPKLEVTPSPVPFDPGFRGAPQFVDIDNDGDIDLASGYSGGYLYLYENKNNVFTKNDTVFAGIKASYASMPAFADIDDDGDVDLLLGSDDAGKTFFYKNNDTAFVVDTLTFKSVTFPRGSSPAFCDIDNDGDFDLFIGETWRTVIYYENTGTATVPVWTKNTELMAGIQVKQSSHPAFADLDGDGRKDLILGEYDGTFTFYKNLFTEITSAEDIANTPTEFSLMQNYPNPFNPSTVITFRLPEAGHVQLKVYDITGREVAVLVNEFRQSGEYRIRFNSKAFNLASGVYMYTLKTGSNLESRKMLLLK